MWVLIIAIYAGTAPAVSSVPGFETKAACEVAAAQWAKANEGGKWRGLVAVCVNQH